MVPLSSGTSPAGSSRSNKHIFRMSRPHFIGYLYDSILFECAGQVASGKTQRFTMAHFAGCFRRVRELYEQDRNNLLDVPSDIYIRQQRLDDPECLGNYIKSLEYGSFKIYPYIIQLFEHRNCNEDFGDYYSWNEYHQDGGCSYADDFVVLAGFKGSSTQAFLDAYAQQVPLMFQNDIAYFIQDLRENYWENRGSGGTYDLLPNKLRVATKFAMEHNSRKRRKIEQKEADVVTVREANARQEEERRLKQQEEERERLRREQEDAERDAEVAEFMGRYRKNEDIVQGRHRDARKIAAERRRINELITQYIDKLQVSLTVTRAREDQVLSLRKRLEKELRARCHHKIKVIRFGSFCSGLCSKKSDADMTVLDVREGGLSIEELAGVLRQIQFQHVSHLSKARVPVATFFDPTTAFFCDVTIGNLMAVANSELLDTYRRIDYRFPTLWYAIRQIAQKHEILSGSTGYLSSYALVMMLIVFLQYETEPAILPKLQRVRTKGVERSTIDGYDCSFDREWGSYQEFGSQNTKSAGEMLMDFLKYFGYTFNYDTQEVNPKFGTIVSRGIDPISPPFSDITRNKFSIVIRDPFITDRNVAGNCRPSNLQKIKQCFQECYSALSRGDIDTSFKR
ncbi:hypothetical protein BGZ47_006264 [Haplosporangium gracile]|nr:hypothetical protein BGZ47_006264 [Haplosporangium gracile]